MKSLIGCLLVFLLGVGSTLAYLAWRDREQAREEPRLSVEEAVETRGELIERLEDGRQRDGSSSLVVTEPELNAMVIAALAGRDRSEDLVRIVREVETEIGPDTLEVSLIVDVEALERSGLVEGEQLERALDTLPFLRGRNLALAFRGTPGVRDGKIAIVDGLEVTIGVLTLPIDTFEERLGFSADRLYSKLVFDTDWFVVEEVSARESELTLEVRR